jgi:UDP-N-acetylglucosamine 2-epimerase (non-hydrolysing)
VQAGLVAAKLGVAVAHVKAGLHSFDMSMPEEINRKLTDAISHLLFVTESGIKNLRKEGVEQEKIFFAGKVWWNIEKLRKNLTFCGRLVCRKTAPRQRFTGC